jgi:hypothetical protein
LKSVKEGTGLRKENALLDSLLNKEEKMPIRLKKLRHANSGWKCRGVATDISGSYSGELGLKSTRRQQIRAQIFRDIHKYLQPNGRIMGIFKGIVQYPSKLAIHDHPAITTLHKHITSLNKHTSRKPLTEPHNSTNRSHTKISKLILP